VVIHVNNAAFAYNSDWARLQVGGSWVDPRDGKTKPYCRRADLDSLKVLALGHEGSGTITQNPSHLDVIRDYVSTHSLQDSIAPGAIAYGQTENRFVETLDQLFQIVRNAIAGDAQNRHTNQVPPGRVEPAAFHCAARPWN